MGKKEGGGGKAKKKKWSKGKSRDKLNNLVLFDKGTYDKLYKEVPTYKLITPSIVSERLKASWLRRRARARRTRPARRPRPRLKPPPKPSSSKSMYCPLCSTVTSLVSWSSTPWLF